MKKQKREIREIISIAAIVVLFVIDPLAMTNGYYNVTATKLGISGFAILAAFFGLGWLAYVDAVKENKGFHFGLSRKHMSWAERFMALFVLANGMAFVCSKYREVSFTGSTDTYLGLFYVILLLIVFVTVDRWLKRTDVLPAAIGVGLLAVVLFALVQFLGTDPFTLLTGLQTEHIYNYLSTLGNTAVYGEYLILMVPVVSYAYCIADHWKKRIFYGICSAVGAAGIMTTNTDAAYLGFGMAVILLAMTALGKRNTAIRYQELLICYGAGMLLMSVLYMACPGARGVSSLTDRLMGAKTGILIGCVVFFLIRMLMQLVIKNDGFYHGLGILVRVLFLAGIAVVILGFILFSGVDRNLTFHGMEKYLRFSKEWGTERGYVWTWLASIWMDAGPVQKLFGAGQGSIVLELFTNYRTEMVKELGYFFDNAHNVYLHLLSTTGLFGVISYIGLIVSSFCGYFRTKKERQEGQKKPDLLPGIAAAAGAYCIQDIVSILQPITWWILIFYLALLSRNDCRCGNDK